jgi:hypothetical protein
LSKLKNPADKKRAAYDRDHRTAMEAPHAFRKNWRKKKARINRVRRRAADRVVNGVLKGDDTERAVVPTRVRGEHLHKDGVSSLREAVANRDDRRRTSFLPTYVGYHYHAESDPKQFRRFLAALIRGRSALAAQRAEHLSMLLDARLPNNSPVKSDRKWLRRFFQDNPEWERRVRLWITRLRAARHG